MQSQRRQGSRAGWGASRCDLADEKERRARLAGSAEARSTLVMAWSSSPAGANTVASVRSASAGRIGASTCASLFEAIRTTLPTGRTRPWPQRLRPQCGLELRFWSRRGGAVRAKWGLTRWNEWRPQQDSNLRHRV